MEERFERNTKPFVSILTPVYNGEKYLAECIESVLEQTYDNWEYVIVNNCSTDRSLEIAKEYAKRDSRIRIHDNREFLEQMVNLNHAFRQISPLSKYCKVVHADDVLFPECVEKMAKVSEEYPSIGIVSSYQIVGRKITPDGLLYPNRFISGQEIGKRYFLQNEFHTVPHPSAIFIRSDLIRKREKVYDEAYLDSDSTAFLQILNESDFGFVYQVLSYTRVHEDSVTNTEVKRYIYMLGVFKIYLDCAPLFLTEVQSQQVIKKRERIFYIQFARSMILQNAREVHSTLVKELKSINKRVKYGKLFFCLIREALLQLLRKMGIDLTK